MAAIFFLGLNVLTCTSNVSIFMSLLYDSILNHCPSEYYDVHVSLGNGLSYYFSADQCLDYSGYTSENRFHYDIRVQS